MSELIGTVDSIAFKSEETGFTVLTMDSDGELITVVGEMLSVNEGEEIHVFGNYVSHPIYGSQFRAEMCEINFPNNENAIFKYLSSGVIKGIGPATARRIVDAFGNNALEVIENSPEKLASIRGINSDKAYLISEEFKKVFGLRTVMLFFSKHGITLSESIKIFKKLGVYSAEIITANPYRLCDTDFGFTFPRADAMAKNLGFSDDSYLRVAAAVKYVLNHNTLNGHTCLPADRLSEAASLLCGESRIQVDEAMLELINDQELVATEFGGKRFIFLKEYFEAEYLIAERITLTESILRGATANNAVKIEKNVLRQISDQEKLIGMEYAEQQKEAIVKAVLNPVFILTGGPGTGKTTTINGMIRYFEFMDKKILLAAPTGRAAKRLSEVTGREAKTIHRLLEVNPTSGGKFKYNEQNPLPCDVIIIDEMSMVDANLFFNLVRGVKPSSKIILVGDADQLPSVGAGNVLKDLISSGMVASVCLNKVFRQAAKSLIVTNAHRIVNGEMPIIDDTENDFFFIKETEDTLSALSELYINRLPKAYGYNPKDDIQIIAPSKKGRYGTFSINERLRDEYNPPSEDKTEVKIRSTVLRVGDKVIQQRNNYDIIWFKDGKEGSGIFNGDIGVITDINKREQVVTVNFEDRIAAYSYEWAEDLELAYAVTVHKSQGSEYNAVILLLGEYFEKLYFRNLLYTAVTRAKKQLIILGTENKINRMVSNNRKTLRYTGLKYFLTGEFLIVQEI
ncbi:MAG: ATP-dependent RecD-like DNA helicase [Oscillospiraceae bacterium]|nr:ATP-dependent RecD-like DNA helicase [Oscillospiraceae bacterium]